MRLSLKECSITCELEILKILEEFHYADYHYWYEELDEKKDTDLFLGFELKDNAVSRYEPVGISWNDSFCRNLGI